VAKRQGAVEGLVMPVDASFWRGKRVLLTGHTGFKGAWLALWLQRLGAHVTGVALAPSTQPNLFDLLKPGLDMDSQVCDIRDAQALKSQVVAAHPDIVLHLAAQALVRTSYAEPLNTFATNVMGTANLLEAVRAADTVRAVMVVTTDKVYHNREWAYPYREDDALGGHDPYSASKAASEMVIASYAASFLAENGVAVASARAGNVIGGGDWSPDRLIPDAVRAWGSGQVLEIRRPEAIRPWQHVLEPLAGYLRLAQTLWSHPEQAGAYNFGPDTSDAATVREVIQMARTSFGKGDVLFGDGTQGPHEAGRLALEIAKARQVLRFQPRWGLAESVGRTIDWYRQQAEGLNPRELCLADIADYEASL
jgi:CDP-glucose 4,6-dehydratase